MPAKRKKKIVEPAWGQVVIVITRTMYYGMGTTLSEAIAAARHVGAEGNVECLVRIVTGRMDDLKDVGIDGDILSIKVPKACKVLRLGSAIINMNASTDEEAAKRFARAKISEGVAAAIDLDAVEMERYAK